MFQMILSADFMIISQNIQIIHQLTFEIRRFFKNKPEILQLKSLTNRILLVQICFITLNVFELFSSKKYFFIFCFFSTNQKIAKHSKMILVISSIVSKTSPSIFRFFLKNLRIFQDPESGLVNDLFCESSLEQQPLYSYVF